MKARCPNFYLTPKNPTHFYVLIPIFPMFLPLHALHTLESHSIKITSAPIERASTLPSTLQKNL